MRREELLSMALPISVLLLVILLVAGTVVGAGESKQEIIKPLGLIDENYVHTIPRGSVVIHEPDNVTVIYGPDNKLLLKAKDDQVAWYPVPSKGYMPVTHIFCLPSGSLVAHVSERTTVVYGPEGDLLLEVIDSTPKKTSSEYPGQEEYYGEEGWIEWTSSHNRDICFFDAHWTCPVEPFPVFYVPIDKICYPFPAIQNESMTAIVQPVLAWNGNFGPSCFPPEWNKSYGVSVYCYNNDCYASDFVPVSEGDSLRGSLQFPIDAPPAYQHWLIYFFNESTGESTVLSLDGGPSYRDVYAHTALEAYWGGDMSADYVYGDCDFTNMEFYGSEWGQEIGVDWAKYVDPYDEKYIDCLNVIIYGSSHTRLETTR